MALETLTASQEQASIILGVDYAEVQEFQSQVTVHELGEVYVDGHAPIPVVRVHTGPEGDVAKGGTRIGWYGGDWSTAKNKARELSGEMLPKVYVRKYRGWRGGKAVAMADITRMTADGKHVFAEGYANLMHEAGLADHLVDSIAGDMGTNGLAGTYAETVHRLRPNYPYWQATATGKASEQGGNKYRDNATSRGVLATVQTLMQEQGVDWAGITIQGFGNVGARLAFLATEGAAENDIDPNVVVNGISDVDGTVVTTHPDGIRVTQEMVDTIGDNLDFNGDKIAALMPMILTNQPELENYLTYSTNNADIISVPTDYFVPAAGGDAINMNNVGDLGARRGVVEGANGPTTREADEYLFESGIVVVPDFVANGAGVDCSIRHEYRANVAMADGTGSMPDVATTRAELAQASETLVLDCLAAQVAMRNMNRGRPVSMRTAASGLYIAQILPNEAIELGQAA